MGNERRVRGRVTGHDAGASATRAVAVGGRVAGVAVANYLCRCGGWLGGRLSATCGHQEGGHSERVDDLRMLHRLFPLSG